MMTTIDDDEVRRFRWILVSWDMNIMNNNITTPSIQISQISQMPQHLNIQQSSVIIEEITNPSEAHNHKAFLQYECECECECECERCECGCHVRLRIRRTDGRTDSSYSWCGFELQ